MNNLVSNEEIDSFIFSCMLEWKQGYWHGYTQLQISLFALFGVSLEISDIKHSVKRLVKSGKLECVPLFREQDLKLNGRGYVVRRNSKK